MIFEALPARYGDSLLLTLEAPNGGAVRLLVDGGPGTVFAKSVKPRLQAERQKLKLDAADPLVLDAIMISHIDEDHILGILDLFAVLRDADDRSKPRPYEVTWLLHNSFDGLLGEGEGGAARGLKGETVLAGLAGDGAPLPELSNDALLVLQSYGQGSQLSTLAAALTISRNPPDQRPLTYEGAGPRTLRLGDATLKIVGPLHDEIEKLRKEWQKYRNKKSSKADLAAYLDKSVPNLSSIVALVECRGKTALLTGDARGDKIIEGLKKAGIVSDGKVLNVDILKLPHHGSERNIDSDFFKTIHADHYVASGDGTYGNPDRATLELIESARPKGDYTIHLTYPASECDETHKEWLAKRKKGKFVAAKHSLVDLLQDWKASKKKIKVLEGAVKIKL